MAPQIIVPNPTVRQVLLGEPLVSSLGTIPGAIPVQVWLGGERDHVVLTWTGFRAAERYAMNLFAALKSADFMAKQQAQIAQIDLP